MSKPRTVTVTAGNYWKTELGTVTLVPDEDYPESLGARWTVLRDGQSVGVVRRHTWTPYVKTGRGNRLRRDLAPRTGWNAERPDGTTSLRHLDTRNLALAFLLED